MTAVGDFARQMLEEVRSPETRATWVWWSILTTAGIMNIYLLVKLVYCPVRRPIDQSPRLQAYQKWMKVAVTFFVIACSFRSFFPVVYATRRCFFSFQSPAVNRTLAFVAEVSLPVGLSAAFKFFLGSLKDWKFSGEDGERAFVECLRIPGERKKMNPFYGYTCYFANTFLDFSILLILFANICCNLGTVSKNHWWFVIEESSWAVYLLGTWFIVVFLTFELWNAFPLAVMNKLSCHAYKDLVNVKRISLLAIIIFMAAFLLVVVNDLPELLVQAQKDCDDIFCHDMLHLNLAEGFNDARNCSSLGRDWELWKYAASWQTPYFTLSVWALILLASFPGTEIFRTKIIS